MKVKIVKAFKDKHTKARYKAGQTKTFTDERVAEIQANLPGYIEVVEEPKKKSTKKAKD